MCFAVYLGSDVLLPERQWQEDAPAFFLTRVADDHVVHRQFPGLHVYYAGSHQGCGCGFLTDGQSGEELDRCRRDYAELANVAQHAFALGTRLLIFACWEGDESGSPVFVGSVTPAEIRSSEFELRERSLLELVAGA